MENIAYSALLRLYLEKYPFRDRLFYHHFVKIKEINISFDDFEDWFFHESNETEVLQIIDSMKETIAKNLEQAMEQLDKERVKVKLAFPSIEDLYEPIGLFDN